MLQIFLPELPPDTRIEIRFAEGENQAEYDWKQEFFKRLYQAEMLYAEKEKLYGYLEQGVTPLEMAGILGTRNLEDSVRNALLEPLLAKNRK